MCVFVSCVFVRLDCVENVCVRLDCVENVCNVRVYLASYRENEWSK